MARPRNFEEGVVLDRATDVFWKLGYEGASMSELTHAMGVKSPSIYATFGSKRGLFDAVLDRYDERRSAFGTKVSEAPTAKAAAEALLYGAVDWLTAPDEPLGCLLIQAGLSTGSSSSGISTALSRRREKLEHLLRQRFARARAEGDLDATVSPSRLARYINVVFLGLAVQAATGTPRKALREAARDALQGFPGAGR